jgi:hypothetical protein
LGVTQDDLGRQIIDPAFGIRAFVRPRPPKLIVLDELRVLAVDRFPVGAPGDLGVQHPALEGEAPFGEVLPGMPPRTRFPAEVKCL